jgi:hypothetical protein
VRSADTRKSTAPLARERSSDLANRGAAEGLAAEIKAPDQPPEPHRPESQAALGTPRRFGPTSASRVTRASSLSSHSPDGHPIAGRRLERSSEARPSETATRNIDDGAGPLWASWMVFRGRRFASTGGCYVALSFFNLAILQHLPRRSLRRMSWPALPPDGRSRSWASAQSPSS